MARTFQIRGRITTEDDSTPQVEKAQGAFTRFASFLASKFVVTLGDVANAARAAYQKIFDAATLEGQTNALRIELAKQGQSFDTFIGKLDEVAKGTVSTADLIKSSSSALLLGIPADKIASLLEIARASAIATGTSVSQAFEDIATGIGRASPMILDNLGLTLKLGPAYEEMARQVGKTADTLTQQEQKTAVLNAVLEAGKSRVEAYGDAQSGLAEAMAQGTAALGNFQDGLAKVVAFMGTEAAVIVNAVAGGFLALAEAVVVARIQWNIWTGDVAEAQSLVATGDKIKALADKLDAMSTKLVALRDLQWSQIIGEGAAAADAAAQAHARLALGLQDTRDRAGEAAPAVQTLADATETLGTSATDANTALEQTPDLLGGIVAQADAASAALERTAASFDALRRAGQGGQAIQNALANGARLINFGTMIQFPDGSVRLVDATLRQQQSGGQFVNLDGTPRRF